MIEREIQMVHLAVLARSVAFGSTSMKVVREVLYYLYFPCRGTEGPVGPVGRQMQGYEIHLFFAYAA